MKKIVIAGGTGYLGSLLAKYFSAKNFQVVILSRSATQNISNAEVYPWNGKTISDWINHLEGADVLINLTGKNVNCRYTTKNKNEIVQSRIDATKVLSDAMAKVANPPPAWINASSATIYNASFDEYMTEQSTNIGNDFSMNVCKEWEKTFFEHEHPQVRKIAARIGIVLGNGGGAFVPMKKLVCSGFGGPQGNGEQYSSWIHENDFCRAIDFLINSQQSKGVYNVTSPDPVPNNVFMKHFRNALHFPIGVRIPKAFLEFGAFFIRTETELLLKSRKVFPKRLLDEGFVFEFKDVKSALEDLCRIKAKKNLSNTLSH